MNSQIKAREVLAMHGISPSRPRVAILKYMQENFVHPTADVIFKHLRSTHPSLSLTTVYNTLKLFAEKGICVPLSINDKQVCYDINLHPHSHFFCIECGRVFDIPQDESAQLLQSTTLGGHRISEVHVYFKGICSSCLPHESN